MFTRGKALGRLAGWLVTAAVVGVVAVLGALLVNGRRADAVTVPFTRLSMAGSTAGDCKALADVDLDGDLDAVVGGFTTLRWFRSDGAAGWAPFTVDSPGGEFTTDCQAADMDGDGDADIVAPNNAGSGALSVYRNPRNPNGDPTVTAAWTRTTINASAGYIHDVEVADVAGDSRLDVVTRRQGNLSLWVQNADGTWAAPQTLNAPSGEGLALGDLDADTDVDVVAGGAWLVNPRVGGGGWTAGPAIVPNQAWGSAAVADMNADGVNDVVLGPLEDQGSPDLAWYSRSGGGWVKTLIKTVGVTAGQNRVHTLKVAKIDAGDSLDVVTGVMRHSNASSGGSLSVFTNDNGSWSEQVVSSTDGVHNVRVGDVERDGDIDILAVNYAGNATPALLWRNDRLAPPDTTPPGTPGAPSAVGAPGSTSLSITWTASTDNTGGGGLKNYDVVRVNAPGGAATLATVTTNTATLTGLSPNTAYQLAVRA
ncbi:MAG: FG-GAP repeat domain-containing protein, partial [Acidimicrobiales bacterium]